MRMTTTSRWVLAVLTLVALGVLLVGARVYRDQERALRRDAEHELEAIAALKVGQIAAWRAEKLADAAVLTENAILTEMVSAWLISPQEDRTEPLLAHMRSLRTHYHYADVLLLDAQGHVRLAVEDLPEQPHEALLRALEDAWALGVPTIADLHQGPGDLAPHVDVVAPLFAANAPASPPVGAFVLRMDAEQFLYPLIQTWPTPSESAETLLVRREGDAVLFLNDLRHREGAALALQVPLDQVLVPAAQAVQGRVGMVEGVDYRGEPVYAALSPVPDSPWFLVSKVDAQEVLGPWRLRSALILGLVAALLTSVALAGATLLQGNARARDHERMQAAEALRESEERHRATLMSVGDAVIATDADAQVTLLNPVAEALTGWPAEEALGQPLEQVFHIINEMTRLPVESPAERVLREGQVVGLANHTLLLGRDGVERPIADSGAPVRAANGEVGGVVLVFRDQSQERAAQRALEESEARFRALFDASPLASALYDLDGRLVECNRAMVELLGYTEGELAGVDPTHPEDRREGAVLFQRLATDQLPRYQREKRYVRKDGRLIWARLSAAPILDADARPRYVILVIEDITARREAQRALADERLLLRTVIDNLHAAIYVKDRQGRKTLANRQDLDNIGASTEAEVLGKTDAELFPFEVAQELMAAEQAVLEAGEPVLDHEERLVNSQGKQIWLATSKLPLLNEQGEIVGLVGIGHDITARKEAEEALARERVLLRTVIDNLPDAIYAKDLQGRKTLSNRAELAMLGLTDEREVLGKTDWDLFAPDMAAPYTGHDALVLQGTSLINQEMELVNAHGRRYWLLTTKLPLRNDQGEIIGLAGIGRDITEHRQAEEALRESEERYRRLAESSQAVLWEYDLIADRFAYVAPQAADLTGWPPQAWTDCRFWKDHLHPEDRERVAALMDTCTARGEPHDAEYRFLRPDGGIVWLRDVASVDMRDGQPLRSHGLMIDITAQREAQEALRRRSAVDSALAALSSALLQPVRDGREIALAVLDHARALTGSVHGYVAAKDPRNGDMHTHTFCEQTDQDCQLLDAKEPLIFPPGSDGRYPGLWGHALNTCEAFYTNDPAAHPAATGLPEGHVPLQSLLSMPVMSEGELIGQIALANAPQGYDDDALETIRRLAELYGLYVRDQHIRENLAESEERLRQAVKMEAIGRLAGGVAHDFNNMLSVISGYAELALDGMAPDDDAHESLIEIRRAAQRSAALTSQLLGFARRQTVQPHMIDLSIVIADHEQMLRRLVGEEIQVHFVQGAELWPVHIDPAQISQILMNLASNARDAIADVGKITLEIRNVRVDEGYARSQGDFAPGEYVMLAFSDTGVGMDAGTQAHLFEPFFTTKPVGQGTGLGLATVYGIVKQNDGFIHVYSEPGQGTSVRIYLPRYREEGATGHTHEVTRASSGSETVLVVEDEPQILALYQSLLERQGYTVLAANHPEDALALCRQYAAPIDLLITDVVMPDMNGRALAERVAQLKPGIRVLFMSGYSADIIAERGILAEDVPFLQKPFDVHTLTAKVREALERG
jgi:PAS domain S-box-containing protein